MKVGCPHCHVAYHVDDRRVPPKGLNVRCPKCRNTFPLRHGTDGAAVTAVPLPGAAKAPPVSRPAAPPPPGHSAGAASSIPLPSPRAAAIPLAPPTPVPAAPAALEDDVLSTDAAGVEEVPAMVAPAAPRVAVPLPPAASAEGAGLPLPSGDAFDAAIAPADPGDPLPSADAPADDPFSAGPAESPAPSAGQPLAFGDVDLDAPAGAARADAAPARAADPFARAPQPPPADPFAIPPPPDDPFSSAAPVAPARAAPAAAKPPQPDAAGDDLEMLFGEGPAKRGGSGYRVRRRSGKVFGPFEPAQIVTMLAHGELLANEDVSSDGGRTWEPIGAVGPFAEAVRKVLGDPPAAERGAPAATGDRPATPRLAAGGAARRRGGRSLLGVAAVLLLGVVGAGVAAGYTPYGFFFGEVLRSASGQRPNDLLVRARASLARGDYPSERAALDLAAQAVARNARARDAAALHAMIVAALEARHGAPAPALEQARRAADALGKDAAGEPSALAARLAVTLAATPGAATVPHETALAQAHSREKDVEVEALLARAALARGDGARAATLFAEVSRLEPAGARGPHGEGLAAALRGDRAAARAAFERALAKDAGYLPSRLELAALAEAEGDAARSERELAPLLEAGVEARLGPLERARALSLRAALLSRRASAAAEADAAWQAAIAADPRHLAARVELSRHRLRHADAPGAVAALEPVATQAFGDPALAAVRVRALASAGRALDALSLAEGALSRAPGDGALLLGKAFALELVGRVDEAATVYADAAARVPNAFEPRLALGRLALARRDLARAATELGAASERAPEEPGVHAALGELRLAQGDAAGAESAYRAALSLDPECAAAETGLARIALARGDAAAARARLERALAIDPRSVDGQLAFGSVLRAAGDLAAAEKAFQAAVDLQPRHAVALVRLGGVKLERGDAAGAVQRLAAAVEEAPQLPEAHHWLGRALLAAGERTDAVARLRRAAELDPADPANHVQLGAALERTNGLEEALEAYRAAAAAGPRLAEPHERIAALYAANGRCDEAVPAYEKAIALSPSARTKLALGDCKLKLGKADAAARIFRGILKAHPAEVQVHYRLARAVHEVEGARAALPLYERAAREEPGNAMPHYYLGYAYKERGQRQRAIEAFRTFLQKKPEADERQDIEGEIEDLGGAR